MGEDASVVGEDVPQGSHISLNLFAMGRKRDPELSLQDFVVDDVFQVGPVDPHGLEGFHVHLRVVAEANAHKPFCNLVD